MKSFFQGGPEGFRRFHTKVLLAMMLVISVFTASGIYIAQSRAAEEAQRTLEHDFRLEIGSFHRLQELRLAEVAHRSQVLAQNARTHAALEDNALDLLYPSAQEELRDLLANPEANGSVTARFYRFLDQHGAVLVPPNETDAGLLRPGEEAQLAQKKLSPVMQTGYLFREQSGVASADEVIALPIRSTENGEVIAALALGFAPIETSGRGSAVEMKSGILVNNQLQLAGYGSEVQQQVAREVRADLARGGGEEHRFRTPIAGVPYFLFYKRLNPGSVYPPAYEVCVYPLQELVARQHRLRSQILGAGGLFVLAGFLVSEFLAHRLAQPVEKLAVVSEENLSGRRQAEAQLQSTAAELQRSARFSADASHQLKTPITVLRAGLDSLLARDGFTPEVYEEVSGLIHQTYRLTGVVEDLLLLSRMDAGRLQLKLQSVDLTHLVAKLVDDLGALPEADDLQIETEIPPSLEIVGETHYTTLIVQNLLDNARKYNRPRGVIRIRAVRRDKVIELRVGNSGRGIPSAARPCVFERFHRAGAAEDVPGHGLGLNLARELARLHGGDLQLSRSDDQWTEFTVVFPAADSSG